ncbi:hypothetical protein [Borreliella yangtzensis]|uniref:Uncharacterized protein n=1 Tax=Borreliella yangtzensis TaxID=683292 RepID=A0ABR6PBL2_9SPIR|nr:hypothetical protein [Borreliella yangtzensis]
MGKKIIIFTISVVFAVISSCKNYADLKQDVKGKVKGFREGVEKKVKQGVKQAEQKVKGFLEKEVKDISDEIAKRLQEEENKKHKKEEKKEEVKVEREEEQEVKDDKQEDEKKEKQEDSNKINQAQILQANSQDSKPELEAVQQSESGGQQKDKKNQQKDKKNQQEEKEKEEREKREKEEKRKQEQEDEQKVKEKIKELTNKIDEINNGIDSIKYKRWFVEDEKRFEVKATDIRDKVTGPILDYFTNSSRNTESDAQTKKSIYYDWGLTDEDDEELAKLLKELGKTRDDLRKNLNEGNQQKVALQSDPKLKENVKVSEIESELNNLKSKLREVKNYLESESNFETIKGYIDAANSNRIKVDEDED